ncbi:twin-arginine translocase TatA/TatE family subunit [Pseudactinotalea sp.]|uniref:twin-arginine translocase TatA/TatE family subunit n=1 Tax=Pseudactinotalea sp. TaxID=1926260 RepID=UPI003B3AA8F4
MNFEEILIIIGIALVVIGPQRLPEYAEQLAKLVKNVRKMATGATDTIREELGDEIADLDLSKFDPRQYDPRRIVREALLDDIIPATKPARKTGTATAAKKPAARKPTPKPAARKPKPVSAGAPVAAAAAATAAAGATIEDAPIEDAPVTADASVADLPPFDDEAT